MGIRKTVFLDGKKKHGSLEFFIEFIPTKMLKCTIEVPRGSISNRPLGTTSSST